MNIRLLNNKLFSMWNKILHSACLQYELEKIKF